MKTLRYPFRKLTALSALLTFFSSALVAGDTPVLSLGDAQALEAGPGTATLIFTLSSASTVPVSVEISFSDGTATAGVDYNGYGTSIISFAPGETNKFAQMVGAALEDTEPEPDETFYVNLRNPQNCVIARTPAVVTIIDDDTPQRPQPTLKIEPIGTGHVRLLWPTNASDFILESSSTLINWATDFTARSVVGTNFCSTNTLTENSQFYRLTRSGTGPQ